MVFQKQLQQTKRERESARANPSFVFKSFLQTYHKIIFSVHKMISERNM